MTDFRLPRLELGLEIGVVKNAKGEVIGKVYVGPLYQRRWQQVMETLEAKLEPAALAAALALVDVALGTISDATDAAQTAADNAQSVVDASVRRDALINSTVSGIAVSSAPATKDITISAHTRNYGDGTSVAVSGGSIAGAGLAYDTLYYLFYDDPTRAGGTVTYMSSTSSAGAGYSAANPDRHYVAVIQTPLSAVDPATNGAANVAPVEVPIEGIAGNIQY